MATHRTGNRDRILTTRRAIIKALAVRKIIRVASRIITRTPVRSGASKDLADKATKDIVVQAVVAMVGIKAAAIPAANKARALAPVRAVTEVHSGVDKTAVAGTKVAAMNVITIATVADTTKDMTAGRVDTADTKREAIVVVRAIPAAGSAARC